MVPSASAPDNGPVRADDPLENAFDGSAADDDEDTGLPPAPLDLSAKQNLLFIEATAAFFGGKATPPDVAKGLKKIEMWDSIMEDSNKAGLGKIRQDFAVLREQLESAQPDAHLLAQAIASLADETAKMATTTVDKRYEEPLLQLSEMLLKMGSSLSK